MSEMKNQIFRRNGLSDDYCKAFYRRPTISSPINQRANDYDSNTQSMTSMNFPMSSPLQPTTMQQNPGSSRMMNNQGYQPQVAAYQRPGDTSYSPSFYMPSNNSEYSGNNNVASLLQNSLHCPQNNGVCVQSGRSKYPNMQSQYIQDPGYHGSHQQQQNFSMGYYGGDANGKQVMASLENIEVPEPSQLEEAYSGVDGDDQLYYYDVESKKLCPINSEDYQDLLMKNDQNGEHEPLHQPEQHVENFEDANQNEVNNSQIVEQETMQQSQQSEEKYEEVSNQNEVSVEN